MGSRSRRLDRALPNRTPGLWIVTILILVLGALLVLASAGQAARDRQDLMDRVRIGDDAENALAALGIEPRRCPGGDLGHLRASFPEGFSDAAIDVSLERLGEVTAERWVFELDGSAPEFCAPSPRRTELGVDAEGRVVWVVAVLGRSAVRLPESHAPAGISR
jgi:hypothetical protein